MSSPQGQPAVPAPSAPSKKWLIFCALAVALSGVGVVAYRRAAHEGEPSAAAAPKPMRETAVVELEPFVVNLADASGDRYLKLSVRLVLDQRAAAQTARQGLAASKLRDRVFSLLSKKRAAELATVAGKEELRAELSDEAERLFQEASFRTDETTPAARVVDVLFTEFLVQ